MKRTVQFLSILSLALVITTTAFAQAATAPSPRPEHLNRQQLNTLIANARTPAEHERIAQYYQAQALDYLGQAKEHEAMIAAYKANSSLSNNKNQAGTINHCQYFAARFRALSASSQELANQHERMASQASPTPAASGN